MPRGGRSAARPFLRGSHGITDNGPRDERFSRSTNLPRTVRCCLTWPAGACGSIANRLRWPRRSRPAMPVSARRGPTPPLDRGGRGGGPETAGGASTLWAADPLMAPLRPLGDAYHMETPGFRAEIRPAAALARLWLTDMAPLAGVEYFLRVVYAFLADQEGGFLLHAAGLLTPADGRVRLFIGRSGSGKSTVAALYRARSCSTMTWRCCGKTPRAVDRLWHAVLEPGDADAQRRDRIGAGGGHLSAGAGSRGLPGAAFARDRRGRAGRELPGHQRRPGAAARPAGPLPSLGGRCAGAAAALSEGSEFLGCAVGRDQGSGGRRQVSY